MSFSFRDGGFCAQDGGTEPPRSPRADISEDEIRTEIGERPVDNQNGPLWHEYHPFARGFAREPFAELRPYDGPMPWDSLSDLPDALRLSKQTNMSAMEELLRQKQVVSELQTSSQVVAATEAVVGATRASSYED